MALPWKQTQIARQPSKLPALLPLPFRTRPAVVYQSGQLMQFLEKSAFANRTGGHIGGNLSRTPRALGLIKPQSVSPKFLEQIWIIDIVYALYDLSRSVITINHLSINTAPAVRHRYLCLYKSVHASSVTNHSLCAHTMTNDSKNI